MNDRICTLCDKPISGVEVSCNGSYAHPHCYERAHPPTPATTFYQVTHGHSDPALAADVIVAMVPPDVAEKIVAEFNRRLMELHRRRCEP